MPGSSRNVLLTGPGLRVKVSDFGLARKFRGDGCARLAPL